MPLRRDLLAMGRSFDDGRTGWADLWSLFEAAPPGSAIHYAISEGWGVGEHLAALAVDTARIQVWQGTENGRKGRKQPEPLPRPGVKTKNRIEAMTPDRIGIAEMQARLARKKS